MKAKVKPKAGKVQIPVLALVAAALLGSRVAQALTTLRQVQASGSSQVDLLFDGAVGRSQVRTEFFNDVIQLSLTDVSVYPAKISAINGNVLTKIFAYQYAPKLVRCRITVKGKAEDYKDRVEIVSAGRQLTLRLRSGGDTPEPAAPANGGETVMARAPGAATGRDRSAESGNGTSDHLALESAEPLREDPAERALLDPVMKAVAARGEKGGAADGASARRRKATGRRSGNFEAGGSRKLPPFPALSGGPTASGGALAGGRPLPSPLGVLGKLGAVLALFGALALLVRKVAGGSSARATANHQLSARLNARLNARAENGLLGALGQLAQSATRGLGRGERMIEVVSTHHLGPKKSIAVVRILGRILVLGVSNEAINLITQIDDGTRADDLDLADLALREGLFGDGPSMDHSPDRSPDRSSGRRSPSGPSIFAGVLKEEALKAPNPSNAPAPPVPATPQAGSVRSQIRSKLEGLKQL